jgi:hypothetical protein
MPCSISQLVEMAAPDVPGDQSTVQIALAPGDAARDLCEGSKAAERSALEKVSRIAKDNERFENCGRGRDCDRSGAKGGK